MTDEIIEELWATKDRMAKENDYDLDSMVADLREKERARRDEETRANSALTDGV